MSPTPRTDNFVANTIGYADQIGAWMAFARSLETETVNLRKELEQVTADFQAVCPHDDWEKVDDSFAHEFGSEIIRYCQCERCGKQKEWDDEGPDSDDGPPERDRDEPDYDAPKPLTPLENHQRNDERNVP